MVKGLDRFRERFASFSDRYVLIGGTAASLVMEEAGQSFRATKDLDIVLVIETLDPVFGRAMWAFIEEGGYATRQQSTGKRAFYRFFSPSTPGFPEMIELFPRAPDALALGPGSTLAPIPVGEGVASLSAILLDPYYYAFIHSGKRMIGGLPAIGADRLIALKARAWLDLGARQREGKRVDSNDVRKHRNDIIRLSRVIDPELRLDVPATIAADLRSAFEALESEPGLDLRALGLRSASLGDLLRDLRGVYGLL